MSLNTYLFSFFSFIGSGLSLFTARLRYPPVVFITVITVITWNLTINTRMKLYNSPHYSLDGWYIVLYQ